MESNSTKKAAEKKGVIARIPGWAWVLISLAVAILLWYVLSINPRTARAFHSSCNGRICAEDDCQRRAG